VAINPCKPNDRTSNSASELDRETEPEDVATYIAYAAASIFILS
jgi:hypothetical protein